MNMTTHNSDAIPRSNAIALATAMALASLFLLSPAAPANAGVPLPMIEEWAAGSLAPLLKTVTPAIVGIAASNSDQLQTGAPNQRGRHTGTARAHQSHGSAIIVDGHQGLIVTNRHLVADAEEISVTLADRRVLPAKLLGSDPDTDIAVIEIVAGDLKDVALGDSSRVEVGDFVFAIGAPIAVGQTVTAGIVSALGRDRRDAGRFEDFIQTDAAIYPGDFGALIDLRGELIGVSAASAGNGPPGMGFIIPSNVVRGVVDQIISGAVARNPRSAGRSASIESGHKSARERLASRSASPLPSMPSSQWPARAALVAR
jgi:serine protease DegQ